jgi:GT2 family glycosyltransferase
MSNTLAAIAIPAYNAEATIGETLDALQANPALSRIGLVALLDDRSQDRTTEIARVRWSSSVPLEIRRNPENMGQWRTTNTLLARLSEPFEWIFVLHADDVVRPNWLALYFDELPRLPPRIATICSSYESWWPASGRINPGEELPDRPAVHVAGNRAGVLDAIERGCWWHLSGCAIRTEAFRSVGGFDDDLPYLGDWEWLLRCLTKGYGVWYLPRTTMRYRHHEHSVSFHSFRQGRDLRETLLILASMRSQGYLGAAAYRGKVRHLEYQMIRRILVRLLRRDWQSFRDHSTLLIETALGHRLGKV